MLALFTGLKAIWDGSTPEAVSVRAKVPGGFWKWPAAKGTTRPYVTMRAVGSDTPGGNFSSGGHEYVDGATIQFSVWVAEHESDRAWEIVALLKALLDNRCSDATGIGVRRMNPGNEMMDSDGGFGVHVDYRYTWQS